MVIEEEQENINRRDFIYVASSVVGGVGTVAALIPFVKQMNPDASTRALSSIEVDLSPIKEGQIIKVMWRGAPVFIRNRTEKEINEAKVAPLSDLKDPEKDEERTKPGHDRWLIIGANCTHLGCVPQSNQGEYGGWFCSCHGSVYDTSGRIRKGPAPKNLPVPPYEFISDTKVKIG